MRLEASKIGRNARIAKSGVLGKSNVPLLAGIVFLGLLGIWFLGRPGRSTASDESEFPSDDGLTGPRIQGRAADSKSVSLAPDLRHPAEDVRFAGPAGVLRGHVEVSGDGPFPTVWTLVLRPSNTLYGRELATERVVEFDGAEQDFTVRDLPLAGYDVLARAAGMNGLALPVLIDKHNPSPFVNLRISPAGFLEGLVRDADGIGADGFPLALLHLPGGGAVEIVTDELGRFRFDGVLDGSYQLILGEVSSPIVTDRQQLRFQAPSMILPDIELPPLGRLILKLVDEQRRLLPDATIKGSGNQGGLIEGATDAYGLFEARYLPAGRYRIRLELEGYVSRRVTLEIQEGEAQEMTLQMLLAS